MQGRDASLSDHRQLDQLIGLAMIYDDIHDALLDKTQRAMIIQKHGFEFSQSVKSMLIDEIPTQNDLHDLAREILKRL